MIEDEELLAACRRQIERCGSGSETARAAFHALHEAWWARVFGWARGKLPAGRAYDAEDLAVATFWKAWQWIGGGAGLPKTEVLLRTCLERAHSDWLRQAYGRAAVDRRVLPVRGEDARQPLSLDDAPGDAPSLADTLAGLDDVEAAVIEREALHEHLAALPLELRLCVQCRFVEGRSVANTAERLKLTPDQVKKRTAQGLALLARRILEGNVKREA